MKQKNPKKNNDWSTPQDFYDDLNKVYNFDFDPCPLNSNFDGLICEWGQRNFVNPPYSRKLKEDFVRKALKESENGKLCVLLLPVSTSTKLFHDVILPNASSIKFIRGRLKFGKNNEVKGCGTFDSMIVVFGNA